MNPEVEKVCKAIRARIRPTKEERAKVESTAKELEKKVALICEKHGVEAFVRIEGSVAKDTWLREEPDIDVFIRLPTKVPRKTLGKIGLRIARESTEGYERIERFAEHPYLEAWVNGIRVNIVPCYKVKRGQWLSATDRTPFHTDYVNRHLNMASRSEIRLLKKFFQGTRIYGAEIKTGGFSGYLCELLILHYKHFAATLLAFSDFSQRIAIDIIGHYKGTEAGLQSTFPEAFVVVDPVDRERNVASAVKPVKLSTLVSAARVFLKKPSADFFFPLETRAIPAEDLKTVLTTRKSSMIFLTLGKIKAVPDVLWGQLYKTQRSLRKLAELNGFGVLRDAVWSNEKNSTVFLFELEQRTISSARRHIGPPLERKKECEEFLSKYLDNKYVVAGPYIEDGRWIVELRRRFTDFVELLREKMKEGGKNSGVAQLMSQAFREKLNVLVNSEVIEVYRANKEFADFLTEFLSGRPSWL